MNIDEIIREALKEDTGAGDFSSLASIDSNIEGEMQLIAKDKGIIAGINIAKKIFYNVDPEIQFSEFKIDGDKIEHGDIIFRIKGKAISMLTAERTVLNFMQRMSGIATYTRKYVEAVEGYNVILLDTRKTTPNFRIIEKYAVKTGGAQNHRFGLYDMIMLKDNHIDFANGIENAIDKTNNYLKNNNLNLKIEIETRNLQEVIRVVAHGGVDRIMFDNFTPEMIVNALKIVNKKFETEASGKITLANIKYYAETGVDFISIGSITHQIKSLDLSLKFVD